MSVEAKMDSADVNWREEFSRLSAAVYRLTELPSGRITHLSDEDRRTIQRAAFAHWERERMHRKATDRDGS